MFLLRRRFTLRLFDVVWNLVKGHELDMVLCLGVVDVGWRRERTERGKMEVFVTKLSSSVWLVVLFTFFLLGLCE